MTLTTPSGTFHALFYHPHFAAAKGPLGAIVERRGTVCRLESPDGKVHVGTATHNPWPVDAETGAITAHPSMFNKATGRQLALTRALLAMFPSPLDRHARREVWQAYWIATNHRDRVKLALNQFHPIVFATMEQELLAAQVN